LVWNTSWAGLGFVITQYCVELRQVLGVVLGCPAVYGE